MIDVEVYRSRSRTGRTQERLKGAEWTDVVVAVALVHQNCSSLTCDAMGPNLIPEMLRARENVDLSTGVLKTLY